MKKTVTHTTTITCLLALTLSACGPLNYPPSGSSGNYPNQYPYGNQYPYDQGGYDSSRDRRERRELEREREQLENERERLENERNQQHSRPPPPPPRPAPERCPSGFSPSEQKCSREERRRGCQDMRLPGGLGCVRR